MNSVEREAKRLKALQQIEFAHRHLHTARQLLREAHGSQDLPWDPEGRKEAVAILRGLPTYTEVKARFAELWPDCEFIGEETTEEEAS